METPSTPAPAPAPMLAPPSPKDSQPGSAVVPGAFSAVMETTYYDSGDEFDYEGKLDGAMYAGNSKHTSFSYSPASCPHTSLYHAHTDLPGQPLGVSFKTKWGVLVFPTIYLHHAQLEILKESIQYTSRRQFSPCWPILPHSSSHTHSDCLPGTRSSWWRIPGPAFISYYLVTG